MKPKTCKIEGCKCGRPNYYTWKANPTIDVAEVSRIITNYRKKTLRHTERGDIPRTYMLMAINDIRRVLQLRARSRR